jgi:hypothetical protein
MTYDNMPMVMSPNKKVGIIGPRTSAKVTYPVQHQQKISERGTNNPNRKTDPRLNFLQSTPHFLRKPIIFQLWFFHGIRFPGRSRIDLLFKHCNA